jgi:hypothetical protein
LLALCGCGKSFDAGSSAAADAGSGGAGGAEAGGASAGVDGTAASGGAARAGAGGTPITTGGAGHSGGAPSTSGAPSTGGMIGVGGTSSTGGAPNTGGMIGVGGVVGVSGSGSMADAGPLPAIPTDGLALWLSADRGVVLKDGQVQQWLDQSGQHMDAIGTATNIQPKFEAGGLNSLPTLDFDGMDDFMTLPEGFSDFSLGASIFIVANAADGACSSMFEASNGTEVQDISLGMYQNTWQYEVENEDLNGGVIDPANRQAGVVASVQRPSGAVALRLTSKLLNQGQFMAPEVVLRTNNFIGHTLYASCGYFQGQISEVIVYDRAVTDKEVLAIENYLEDHWVLTPPL